MPLSWRAKLFDRLKNKLRTRLLVFLLPILLIAAAIAVVFCLRANTGTGMFDGERAYQHVLAQVDFGARTPGSPAHVDTALYIQRTLTSAGWQVELQQGEALGHPLTNIVAKRGDGAEWIILGAHYDTRLHADREDSLINQTQPVPGANDGASGVAVLLELARVLPKDLDREVWLVFFDLEDQGRIEGWEWILGSQAFAETLAGTPDAVVIVDMVGDADLNLYREKTSTPELVDEIWSLAAEMGYDAYFINAEKHAIMDDHTPFLNLGINAVDIIDFDYPYWHTLEDTADKVAPRSLKVVGDVLLAWLTR